MNYTVPDKKIAKVLPKHYVMCTNENEAVAMAGGYWLARKKRANVYISADGFMNTLNFLTSWIIPDGLEMNLFISIGRTEKQHYIATGLVPKIIKKLKEYDESERISYEFVK